MHRVLEQVRVQQVHGHVTLLPGRAVAHLGLADHGRVRCARALDEHDAVVQSRLAHSTEPGVGFVRHPVLTARVHHGHQHLQLASGHVCLVGRQHHLLRQDVPVLCVAGRVDGGEVRAHTLALGVPQLVAVDDPLLKVRPNSVYLHDEACVRAALHVHRRHQKPGFVWHHVALQRFVLAHQAPALGRLLERARQVRHTLVGVDGHLQRQLLPGECVVAQPLQVAQHQRAPVLICSRAATKPIPRDAALDGFTVPPPGGRDLLAVAQPHPSLVQPVLGLRRNHAAAVRADDVVVFRRQRTEVGLPHQVQQLVVIRQAEQPKAG